MILRISGAVLIVAAGALAGEARLREMSRHVRLLADMSSALGEMKSEICMLLTPLPQLFEGLALRGPESARSFFEEVLELMEENGVSGAWRSASNTLLLPPAERDVISGLSSTLGRYDAPLQGAELQLARERLEAFLEQAKAQRRTGGKTSLGLGLSLGAMLAVILF